MSHDSMQAVVIAQCVFAAVATGLGVIGLANFHFAKKKTEVLSVRRFRVIGGLCMIAAVGTAILGKWVEGAG